MILLTVNRQTILYVGQIPAIVKVTKYSKSNKNDKKSEYKVLSDKDKMKKK